MGVQQNLFYSRSEGVKQDLNIGCPNLIELKNRASKFFQKLSSKYDLLNKNIFLQSFF